MNRLKAKDLSNLSKTELIDLVTKLYGVIQDLEDRVSKNSQNSGKPPSSDGYLKPSPKSRREKTDKSVGGQNGHTGNTLQQINNPDLIKVYKVTKCCKCGASLEDIAPIRHECRQEFDIIKPRSIVTEHQGEVKICSTCLTSNTSVFPDHINSPAQYGINVRSYSIYLNQYQLIPFKRLQEMFKDCFDLHISQGSLVNFNRHCANKLSPALDAIKSDIVNSKVAHFDEISMRINGKINWLHVASTKRSTYYGIHSKRGNVAMDKIGILPKIQGTAIHDYWKPYMRYYQCRHALCNAHHLRELEFIYERSKKPWAKKMMKLLLRINKVVTHYKGIGENKLPDKEIGFFEKEYQQIMDDWFNEAPIEYTPSLTKRSQIEIRSENLGDRFNLKRHLILGFMYNFDIEFTNNLAEQDIRMCKVKSKISGSFRSDRGSSNFVKIRSYISTIRKNKQNILDALSSVFDSTTPLLPDRYLGRTV